MKGDLAALVAAEEARREAEAAARRLAPAPHRRGPATAAGARAHRPSRPPPTGPASAGRQGRGGRRGGGQGQIGKPYVYGGSGPDSFDCSGLTAWAWRAGGVLAVALGPTQYYETTRVPAGRHPAR